ncbi:uroporphyrinogen decarboxylase family protein [Thermodesulfobacteriota bacterium]
MMKTNKKDRIHKVLSGETPDRIPVSIWGHDFLREWSAKELAAQTIEKQQQYDYDFVKLNPRWAFFPELWGNQYEPPDEQRHPRLLHKIIEKADDFSAIEMLTNSHPVFEEHLQALEAVLAAIGEDVDVIYTLFSPLAVAGHLCGGTGEPLLTFAKQHPKLIHQALETIAKSLKLHVDDVLDKGASGLFFASLQWTSTEICDPAFYSEFGRPYDLAVLDSAKRASFNMLHICGNQIQIDRFIDYPVQVLNWDSFGPGNPSLAHVHGHTDKVVAGGIPHREIHKLSLGEIKEVAEKSVAGIKDRVMLTGGCAVGALLDPERRRYVRDIAENILMNS